MSEHQEEEARQTESDIACSLGPADLRVRQLRWRSLLDRALIASQRRATGIELRLRATEATKRSLEDLVGAERECCPFLAWALAEGNDEIVLDIAGPAGTEPIFDGWERDLVVNSERSK